MITALSFTNLTPSTYNFIGTTKGIRVFAPKAAPRTTKRPLMQAHGRSPAYTYFDGLDIRHEGIIKGGATALMTERKAMLDAILGDLSAAVTAAKLGKLTVKYAGWTETASADVTLEDYDVEIHHDPPVMLPYLFQWVAFLPYFVGDTSGTKYHL